MLLFRSEEEVGRWCAATGALRGEALPLAQVWDLAQAWYGDQMDLDFRGRTAEHAAGIFARAGLVSAFWSV